jgi:arylsulfatase A-like enzyme
MMKPRINLIIIFLFGALNFISCQDKKVSSRQPNFIVFIADDAAWDDSGAYGNTAIHTPNIDQLAKEGMRFTNAMLTTSSCSPSRCSILTGLYPHNTEAQELHMPLPADKILFAGELQKAGYYTVSSGKYHIGPSRSEFDTIYTEDIGDSGCEKWLEALKERPKDKPFFLWLASKDPHRIYKPNIIAKPHDPSTVIVPPYLPDNDSTRKDLAMYYDEIARLDSYIGKVLDELKAQGEDENTLVIYMSDNGRPFPRCKTRMYNSGVKTPFIVRWPENIAQGTVSNSLVSSIDIAPTFVELAGRIVPDVFQGKSFAPILNDANAKTREYTFSEHNWHDYQAHERQVRNDQFLYVWNAFPELNATPPADAVVSITYQEMIRLKSLGQLTEEQMDCFVAPRSQEELYDFKNDPDQFNNLVDDPEYAEALTKMRTEYKKWVEETNDKVAEHPTPDKFDRLTGKKIVPFEEGK